MTVRSSPFKNIGCLSRSIFDCLSPRLQEIAIELSEAGEFSIEGLLISRGSTGE